MKLPFDLSEVFKRIEKAIAPYPKAAMFYLYDSGYNSLFEQLIACIISIRTLDETTIPVAENLFKKARTPKAFLKLSVEEITSLLYGSTFAEGKAQTILNIAKTAEEIYGGELPPEFEKLIALKGVGPKCANLAVGVATGQSAISVDVHVHRVVNRWGIIHTKSPEKTMHQLETIIPKTKWTDVNRLLMPFGKHICKGPLPLCSTCPILHYCQQIGVTKSG